MLAIVGAWALLYLPHLGTSPRWYGDETITVACGHDLVRGIFANRATWNTYINPQFVYIPGYVALMGGASLAGGKSLLLPRFLNTLIALATAIVICRVLAKKIGLSTSLAAALVFLCFLQSVIHFRWIYAHNLVALGFAICFCVQCLKTRPAGAWISGAGLALAAASHPLALQGGILAAINSVKNPRTWPGLFLPPAIVGIACILPVILKYPAWFFEDTGHLSAFYRMYSEDNSGGWRWVHNAWSFCTQDGFHVIGTAGALVALFSPIRPVAIAFLGLVFMLTANRQNLTLFYYQAVILLPLCAICGTWLIFRVAKFLRWKPVARILPFGYALVLFAASAPPAVSGKLVSRNDLWVTQSIADATAAAAFVNARVSPDELVLSHWNAGWLLGCRTADYLQATAYSGKPTHTFEHVPGHERFRFPVAASSARFAIIADIDLRWTLHNPNVMEWFRDSGIESWPVVFSSPTYTVLENPDKRKGD